MQSQKNPAFSGCSTQFAHSLDCPLQYKLVTAFHNATA